VQTNAASADAAALADMEKELEEVVHFLASKFKPELIRSGYFYFFVCVVNDGEEEGDWEGMVGQLKKTIEDSTGELENNL
jgi:hypothetical protein